MKVFSAFSGIGGFELGIHAASIAAGMQTTVEIVGYSEIDKYAISVYDHQFTTDTNRKIKNYGDITQIDADQLPDFDCLTGGFPCQAFSQAGKRRGFADTRGTLFFDLARLLQEKRPRLFVFENVKGLLSHDHGHTFTTIITTLDELGYDLQWQVLNSKNFGVAQNRERIFIVGHLRGEPRPQVFPLTGNPSKNLQPITRGAQANRIYNPGGIATTLASQGGGLGAKTGLYVNKEYASKKFTTRPTTTAGALLSSMYKGVDRTGATVIAIQENTKKGYAEASVGDSINLAYPYSNTRRGRVGKGIAQTVTTGQDQYTIQPVLTPNRVNKRQNGRRTKSNGEPAFTVTANDQHGIYDGVKVRRLTPLECERLQAFPDNWTSQGIGPDGNQRAISDTQRYKMCGNAVTTTVVQAVFEKLFTPPESYLAPVRKEELPACQAGATGSTG